MVFSYCVHTVYEILSLNNHAQPSSGNRSWNSFPCLCHRLYAIAMVIVDHRQFSLGIWLCCSLLCLHTAHELLIVVVAEENNHNNGVGRGKAAQKLVEVAKQCDVQGVNEDNHKLNLKTKITDHAN